MNSASASVEEVAGATGIGIKLVDDEAGLRALEPEWDSLLARMARPCPFLKFAWVETWWRHFCGRSRLFVLAAHGADGALLGVAPLHVVRRRALGIARARTLEFIGYRGSAVCADHLDFIAPADRREHVVEALVGEALRRANEWDAVVLGGLAEDSAVPRIWQAIMPSLRWSSRPEDICYFYRLPGTTDDLWTELKRDHPSLASGIKRNRSRLQKEHAITFVPQVQPVEVDAALRTLVRLHGKARARMGQTGNLVHPEYLAFHSELVQKLSREGSLYLARLECDGQPAAILYGYSFEGVLYYYQAGFDTDLGRFGVGTLLMAAVFEDAVTRLRAREFDFLRGNEEYKSRWTARARRTQEFRAWRPTLAGHLAALEHRARRHAAAVRDRRKAAAAHT